MGCWWNCVPPGLLKGGDSFQNLVAIAIGIVADFLFLASLTNYRLV